MYTGRRGGAEAQARARRIMTSCCVTSCRYVGAFMRATSEVSISGV